MGWVIWNDLKKEYQFPSINEETSLAAGKKLVKKIGKDAAKYRFEIVNKEQFEAKREKNRIDHQTDYRRQLETDFGFYPNQTRCQQTNRSDD